VKVSYQKIIFDVFPPAAPPVGAERVHRWYQLDAASRALLEWWSKARETIAPPAAIFLASPGGCDESDGDFGKSRFTSPQKFVHTLPSVRVTPLLQVMDWAGPVICVQRDPFTFATAVAEAQLFLSIYHSVWVLGVKKLAPLTYGVLAVVVEDKTEAESYRGENDDRLWQRAEAESTP
jgi:hypothetical protein